MARPRIPSTAPAIPSSSMVASATRYPKRAERIYQGDSKPWQTECYRHYAICGEARFAANFFGNAMSRAVLSIRKPGVGEGETVEGGALDKFNALFNGSVGQAQMLKEIGTHLTIAGECYLVGREPSDHEAEVVMEAELWEVVSPVEISVVGKKWMIRQEDRNIELTDEDVVIRIWNPRPGARMEADSPFRSLLPILSEIEWLTRHVFAQVSSRLAGAGILLMSEGMTFPPPADADQRQVDVDNEADAFMVSLADAMMTPIRDPGSPSALVPLIVTGPADDIEKSKLLQFWSELDAAALELRSEAIRRFAVGMDLPAEQVLGIGSANSTGGGNSNGVSHWGAWQIEEATIKMHVEPMLQLVCNAITVAYLRPLLDPGADEYVGWDTSPLRLRPDRSKEAFELYDRGLLKATVLFRENGFDPDVDMMEEDEFHQWLLRKIASGSATPEQVEAAMEALGAKLDTQPALEGGEQTPRESRPAPSLEDHPSRPRTPGEAALLAACDGLVWRALEKAGNRYLNARTRGKDRDKTIDPAKFHLVNTVNGTGPDLLDGAFAYAPNVLDGLCDSPDDTILRLRDYCLALFQTNRPHTRSELADWMGV